MFTETPLPPINDETTYRALLAELDSLVLIDPEPFSADGQRLLALTDAVVDYEKRHFPMQ